MTIWRRRSDERGAVALFVAVFVTSVGLILTAWVTEFGLAFSNKRVLQNAVDAAALAAANHVKEHAPANTTCASLKSAIDSQADGAWNTTAPTVTTASVVDTFFEDNAQGLGTLQAKPNVECDPELGLLLSVSAVAASQTPVGAAAGVEEVTVSTEATAVVGTAASVTGLRPIGICKARALEASATPGAAYAHMLGDKGDNVCGLDMSVWGLINFEGSRGNGGDDGLKEDLRNGYGKPITASTPDNEVWIDGSPGMRTALFSELLPLVGQEVVLPVYDQYRSKGKDFRIVGFITVDICGVETSKGTDVRAPCTRKNDKEDWLMFVHRRFTPIAEVNTDCPFAQEGCVETGARVVKLAR